MVASLRAIISLSGASPSVLDSVLQLNQLNATELSELDRMRLSSLIRQAFQAVTIDDGAAFLIAFDQDAEYESPNFHWFQNRYPRFVYVDRIAVAASARGQGLARRFYRELFSAAAAAGHSLIACEVNVDPPNPASDSFHRALGFQEVGRASLGNGKIVSYLTKQLANLAGGHENDH